MDEKAASLMRVLRKAFPLWPFQKEKEPPLSIARSLEVIRGSSGSGLVEKPPCGERVKASTPEIQVGRALRPRCNLKFILLFFMNSEKKLSIISITQKTAK